MNFVDVIRMQAATRRSTYVVTVIVNEDLTCNIKTIGELPKNVKNIVGDFDGKRPKKVSLATSVIKDEMERNSKFLGAAR